MLRVQKDVATRYFDVIGAWEKMRPDKKFFGLSLEEFRSRARTFLESRDEIAGLEAQLSRAVSRRDVAAIPLNDLVQSVVSAVKGDPTEGHNGELYSAMGYVPKNQRSTGARRSRKVEEAGEGVSS
ncbi:MAG: hypothetical protein WDO56_21280 [Gammaproteobacteria bacterium]